MRERVGLAAYDFLMTHNFRPRASRLTVIAWYPLLLLLRGRGHNLHRNKAPFVETVFACRQAKGRGRHRLRSKSLRFKRCTRH
jgi:hypothetical protein